MNTETASTAIAEAKNYTFVLMEQFARLFADSDMTEQLFELRFHALRELHGIITALQKRSFHARICKMPPSSSKPTKTLLWG